MKIDLREFNKWISERFEGKDLITFEELMADYEELILENEHLKEEQEEQEQDEFEIYRDMQLEKGNI